MFVTIMIGDLRVSVEVKSVLTPAMLSGSFRKKIKHNAVFLKGDSQMGCVRLRIVCLPPVMSGRAAER